MPTYLDVTSESGKIFYQEFIGKGKIVMLNLLKYKVDADYTNLESIKPENQISGQEAYQLYIKYTLPELKKAGSKILFFGNSNAFLIGPDYEHWDCVLLIEHQSVKKFMEFAQNETYLRTMGHRTAALEDSRLLPITSNDKYGHLNT